MKKERAEKDEEERTRKLIGEQIERAKKEIECAVENISLPTTSISFSKPSTQKKSLSALVKKSNPMGTQKKEKDKEQPKKLSAMEEIIREEMEKKKRMENFKLNGNKGDNRRKDDHKDNRDRDHIDR